MKTLGLIGGMSWVSTVDYYRIINQQINERLGGINSAKILLYSLNFEKDFKLPADADKWEELAADFTKISRRLENAGAECIVICANTPHMIADSVRQKIHIPLIHISEVTAAEVKSKEIKKIGLLGTKFTMERNFFKDKLAQQHIETLIPAADDREFIHSSILNEFSKGIFAKATKGRYLVIIDKLVEQGAEGIIFGCTEIPLLLKQEDCPVPIFDTTFIHAKAAVDFALKAQSA